MFTGIVEEIGRVEAVVSSEAGLSLSVAGALAHVGTQVGDSVAVNGVCLTVVEIDGARLRFDAVPETLRRSNLGALEVGAAVNLERAMGGGRTFGGHYVQGHVDGTVRLRSRTPDGDAVDVWFDAPAAQRRYIVEKGFVTVDGASLTVVAVDAEGFGVTLVPHTQTAVVFGAAAPGYVANLEVDVMAKYVERLVGGRIDALEARVRELEGRRP